MISRSVRLVEQGWIPDQVIRFGIRHLCKIRLKELARDNPERFIENNRKLYHDATREQIAVETKKANKQHYELPTEFFKLVLGNYLKYSCSYFKTGRETLTEAEVNTLGLYADRAQLIDGQSILDLGCGWGSMTLYMAERYPNSRITAVSNSHTQRQYIESELGKRGLSNVRVITCDINYLELTETFDRIVSIEMLEHVTNHQVLFAKIASWMNNDALMFVHIFTHLLAGYRFMVKDETDWMAQYFFSGGMMPADQQFLHYQKELCVIDHWVLNGSHYEQTANLWLKNMDHHKQKIMTHFKATYGNSYKIWFQRWRVFFMSCAELFAYRNGSEWVVSHYLFTKR